MKPTPNLGRSRSLQPQNQRTTQDVKGTCIQTRFQQFLANL